MRLLRLAEEWAGGPVEPRNLLPIDVRIVAEQLLGLKYDEREELREDSTDPGRRVVVGKLDRETKTITVSGRQSKAARRYAGAHEIGHYEMHPQLVNLHEKPIEGGQQRAVSLPIEREAQEFAAEFLMPDKLVRELFYERFGRAMGPADIDENVAHYLSVGRHLVPSQVRAMEPVDRAKLFANATTFWGVHFPSMTEGFGVSCEAMAYRLFELGLVK